MYKIDNGIFTIDQTTSPVIELDCSVLRDNGSLSCGRLFFQGGYDGREAWVAYPESLYGDFKKVVSFMKRCLLTEERMYLAYVSKGSHSYVSNGGRLVQI
jgi:hypothetical protein